MRSNGAVHLGNNTFAVALRGVDSALHLITRDFPDVADQVVHFPLDLPTAFCITTTLTAVEERFKVEAEDGEKKEAGLVRSPTRQFRSTAVPHRHVLHASDDGRHVAVISTITTQHYILDLQHIPITKCALETDEVVRSVCWHPTEKHVLVMLLASGRIVIYDVRYYPLGVVLPIARELDVYKYIPLKHWYRRAGPSIKEERIDSKIEPFTTYSALAEKGAGTVKGTGGATDTDAAAAAAALKDQAKRQGHYLASSTGSSTGGSRVPQNMFGYRNAAGLYTSAATGAGGGGASKATTSRTTGFSEDGVDGLPLPITKEDGEDEVESVDIDRSPLPALDLSSSSAREDKKTAQQQEKSAATPKLTSVAPAEEDTSAGNGLPTSTIYKDAKELRGRDLYRLTGPMDPARVALPPTAASPPPTLLITAPTATLPEVPELVDTAIVRPTRSLPPTLLLLTALGDVYSCKINDKGLPRTDISSGVEHKPSEPPSFLTHKMCYLVDSGVDEAETDAPREIALAARSCHLDVERELHAVVTVFNNGRAKVAYVSESDLIGQPRDKRVPVLAERQVHGVVHYSVSVQLGPPIDAGAYLSMEVPTTTHLVQMNAQDNVCLIRYGSEGAVFLLVLPVWLSERGWCYFVRGEGNARAPATPIISTDAMVVPTPLSFRLPFATKGKSVSLSGAQLLIVPEEVVPSVATDTRVTRADVIAVDLLEVVQVAMYATLGAVTRAGHAPPQGKDEAKKEEPKKTGAAAAENVWTDLDQSLELAKKAHAAFLARINETDKKQQLETQMLLEDCTTKLELANRKTSQRFTELANKQTKLRLAREELERNVQQLSSQIEVERTTILNGIAHRRGVKGIHEANEKLATMHKILTVVEERLRRKS